MDNGLLRSTDGGKSYEALFPKSYSSSTAGHVWQVEVDGQNIIATSSPWNEYVNQIVLSTDGGNTFTLVRDGLPDRRPYGNTMWHEGYPRAMDIDPNNPDRIYLGLDGDTRGGLYISTNGGKTWLKSSGQPKSLRIYNGLSVDPTDSNRIFWPACGWNGGVHMSPDQGKTWQMVFTSMSWVFDLAIASDGTIFAAGDKSGAAIYRSTDHGQTWELLKTFSSSGAADGIAIDPANPNRIAVGTAQWAGEMPQKIFLSNDKGSTWQEITGDLPGGLGTSDIAFSPDGQYLYITRYAGSVYKIKI